MEKDLGLLECDADSLVRTLPTFRSDRQGILTRLSLTLGSSMKHFTSKC